MNLALLGDASGGIGLFLLGMLLMTDGLKLSAGPALRHILSEWTRTPLRGLFSGMLITSLVQSSSAVTVATIGFVNAGLLGLLETVYVIFGSNVGTTMTGWLVALVGFKLDVKAFALPLVAVGMLLKLVGGSQRTGALGTALAGFGLFFLGIDVLKDTFEYVGRDFALQDWVRDDPIGLLMLVGVGFVLTLLMQSSSAAMAITLTAAAGGLLPLTDAAAVVVGANLGTTSTATLAVIGATSNARRVAAAHVLFNVITGGVALMLLAPLVGLITGALVWVGVDPSAAVVLALFHTVFNLLGVAIMWPLTPRLVVFLERRFQRAEADAWRPRFLDRNVMATPALALDALSLELGRIAALGRTMAKSALSAEAASGVQLGEDRYNLLQLAEAVRQFSIQVQRSGLSADLSEALANGIRVARYYEETADMAQQIATTQAELAEVTDAGLAEVMARLRSEAVALIDALDPTRTDFDQAACEQRLTTIERHYQEVKGRLLRAGAQEQLPVRQMVAQLDQYSDIRRLVEQAFKGAQYLAGLMALAAQYRTSGRDEPGLAGA